MSTSVYDRARAYLDAFRSDVDDPNLSAGETELRDLAALRDAVDEAIAVHIRELVAFEGLSWSAVATTIAPSPASLRKLYGRASKE